MALAGDRQLVQDHLEDLLVAAEPIVVVGEIGRGLDPHRAGERRVLDHLGHEAAEVIR